MTNREIAAVLFNISAILDTQEGNPYRIRAYRRAARNLDNVIILGQRPKHDMPAIWTATDASLILLRRNDLFRKVIPSKMFEAMAMRIPIILGVEGEACELLQLDRSGRLVGIPLLTPSRAPQTRAATTSGRPFRFEIARQTAALCVDARDRRQRRLYRSHAGGVTGLNMRLG